MLRDLIVRTSYEENEEYDLAYPNLTGDGGIAFSDLDGEVAGPVRVRSVMRSGPAMRKGPVSADAVRRRGWRWRGEKFDVYVTDARLVFHRRVPGSSYVWAGHLRYPALCSLAVSDRTLAIRYADAWGGPERSEELTMDLRFSRSVDVGALAQDLLRRVAQHTLQHLDVPENLQEVYRALAGDGRSAGSSPSTPTVYPLPCFRPFPAGLEYVCDQKTLTDERVSM